jgi:hypothetical protein
MRDNNNAGIFLGIGLVMVGLGACIAPMRVVAQTACPAGVSPGSVSCLPDQLSAPPPRPAGEWIKTWGALAYNEQRDLGFSSQKISKADAEEEAVNQCKTWGIEDCHVETFFFNQCVAVARTDSGAGTVVTAAPKKKAVDLAKKKCDRDTGGVCKVWLAECSLPIFEFYK